MDSLRTDDNHNTVDAIVFALIGMGICLKVLLKKPNNKMEVTEGYAKGGGFKKSPTTSKPNINPVGHGQRNLK